MTVPARRYLNVSNLFTYLSLSFGLSAVFVAARFQSWHLAGLLIAGSVMADIYDGPFARRFHRSPEEEQFGVELNSLVDAVCFSVVPVVCLYLLTSFGGLIEVAVWVTSSVFYTIMGLTRLGSFNMHHSEASEFVGMPTTLAGLIWVTLFLIHPVPPVTRIGLVVLGWALVSSIRFPRPRGWRMLVLLRWWSLVAAHIFNLAPMIGWQV